MTHKNSTLIDGHLEMTQSLSNLPEEIKRFSPILSLKQPHDKYNNESMNKTFDSQNNAEKNVDGLPAKKAHPYGDEEGVIESVTVWIGDTPRCIFGVTKKTTCNRIIKALLDNEVQNENNGMARNASRDYNDYIIAECCSDIQRGYDGNMEILPLWEARTRTHDEIRLKLLLRKDVSEYDCEAGKKNKYFTQLRRYLRKWLTFTMSTESSIKKKAQHESSLPDKRKMCEFVIVALDDKEYSMHNDKRRTLKSVHHRSTHADSRNILREKLLFKLNNMKQYSMTPLSSKTMATKKKVKGAGNASRQLQWNSAHETSFTCRSKTGKIGHSMRNKLAQKTLKINQLYEREQALDKELLRRCQYYKLQNELYTNPKTQWEISIEQIQSSIENCAEDIIRTEHELFELKNKIKRDIATINYLKRMSLEKGPHNARSCKRIQDETVQYKNGVNNKYPDDMEMQFVDNIYEFCDTNQSVLV